MSQVMNMNKLALRPAQEADRTEPHTPLLSVTVLNYNYARYLPQCLDSILRQTWTDFELLLINDCSTDNSLEVIQPYLADPRVTLINHEQNQGFIASLIEGSDRSRGKYLTMISADDICASDCTFEILLNMLDANPDAVWAHAAFGVYDSDLTRGWVAQHHTLPYVRDGHEEYQDLLLLRTYVSHSGTFIRASAYKSVGGYDPGVRYACDMLMWLRLCNQGKAAYSPQELYGCRRHDANMSHSRGGIRQGLREHIAAINSTFAAMQTMPGISKQLYRRAMRKSLISSGEQAIFAGRLRIGWYALWCAMEHHPVWTIMQLSIPKLVVRTLLGARGFGILQSWMRYLFRRHSSAAYSLGGADLFDTRGT
jgi:glycosyltransferase involved in cell wall biosynthesis